MKTKARKMASEPKRRRIEPPSRRTVSSTAAKKETIATSMNTLMVPVAQTDGSHLRIQQAKKYAVAQAQQEGSTGNFRIFDSPYGNFLVPVIPTRAELAG
ncbi:hypothetical protein L1049_023162 [Liquidambar formosana]|uniref:Uncharacterized protein n=1 Tax=Liquidambar formosana TaxID=63359 RepID=A0AAP0WS48_LIQFO